MPFGSAFTLSVRTMANKTPVPFYTDKMGNKIVSGDLVVYGTKYGTRVARVREFYNETNFLGYNRVIPRTQLVMSVQGTWVHRPTKATKGRVKHLSKVMKISSAFVSLDALTAINK
jgi:hypothetical protein